MTQLWTTSRLRVIRECLRKHHLRYNLALQMLETDSMRFGTVGHQALEAYYRAWMLGSMEDRLYAALNAIGSVSEWDAIKLHALVVAYHHRWGAADWEVLAVEQEFQFLLGERIIAGKIDALIRDRRDSRIYVVEHKTTGTDTSVGGVYWDRLAVDTQVSIYIDGASMLGYEVAGCVYDVLRRPGHDQKLATPADKREYTKGKGCKGCGGSGGGKAGIVQGRGYYDVVFASVVNRVTCQRCAGTGWLCDADGAPQAPRLHANQRDTDETADEFEMRIVEHITADPDATLLRGVVVRLDDELPAMRQDLLDVIALAETGLTPRNPDACVRAGRMCAFFDACSGRASLDSFPRGEAHPELSADSRERAI